MGYLVTDENNIAIVYFYISLLRRAINAIVVRASDMTAFLRGDRNTSFARSTMHINSHIPHTLILLFIYIHLPKLAFLYNKMAQAKRLPCQDGSIHRLIRHRTY